MAKPKVNSTALTKWDERLAAMAKSAKKAEANVGGDGNFISLKSGIMTYRGATVPGNKMNVIIIDGILENQFYEGAYDANSPQTPRCYAHGRDPDTMAPNPLHVLKPISTDCNSCENLQWGSADSGKGKACGEVRRLGLIPENELDNIEDAEVAYLKVPVMSVKGWAGYVRQLEELYNKPPIAFVTEISVVPDAKSTFRVLFNLVSQIEDAEAFEALLKKYDKVSSTIAFPYPKLDENQSDNGKNGKAKKAAAPAKAEAKTMPPAGKVPPAKVGVRRPVKPAKF